ncbi:glutathione S-transferase, partial [Serratia sp. PL17]|nr:glutathione S-transferase [Serratia sp. PL17]
WIYEDNKISDKATYVWVNALVEFYAAGDILGLSSYSNVQAWLERGLARPAVQRGLRIPARPAWGRLRKRKIKHAKPVAAAVAA